MNKFLYSFVFLFTSLYADLAKEDMTGIYIEGAAFLTVVFVMAVIANKVSSRHAKEHKQRNKEKLKEHISKRELKKKDYARYKERRVKELLKLVDDKVITEDEFGVIQRWLYN